MTPTFIPGVPNHWYGEHKYCPKKLIKGLKLDYSSTFEIFYSILFVGAAAVSCGAFPYRLGAGGIGVLVDGLARSCMGQCMGGAWVYV